MKNIVIAIILFLTINLSAQVKKESIRATYKAEFIFDYEQSKDMFPKDIQPVFKKAIDRGVFVDFILESNNQLSVFKADMIVQEILQSE